MSYANRFSLHSFDRQTSILSFYSVAFVLNMQQKGSAIYGRFELSFSRPGIYTFTVLIIGDNPCACLSRERVSDTLIISPIFLV